jgi:UDP:flavonoid glycosyltransferase YjiC (YdhE family)
MLRRISRQLRVRMVVEAGWLKLNIDDDHIYTVGPTPHSWLLPRVRAAVYHAGAGTSAAALRAGTPRYRSPRPWTSPSGPPGCTAWA